MNFLQCVQALRQETTDAGSGPSTVVAQTGEAGRFVKWVADSWSHLQQDRVDWLWMRHAATVNTVASTATYAFGTWTDTVLSALITRFASWYTDNFKCYLQSSGVGAEYPLVWLLWEDFRRIYNYGAQNNSQPTHISMDPQQVIHLGPVPDDIYVVSGDYQLAPQIMALDADIPEMPSRFHDLIVYESMARYGGNRIATEVMTRAIAEGGRLRAALEIDQLPPMTYGPALASGDAYFQFR